MITKIRTVRRRIWSTRAPFITAVIGLLGAVVLALSLSSIADARRLVSDGLILAATEVEAMSVLGRPVPQPHVRPNGLSRIQIAISAPRSDPRLAKAVPRQVRQSFAVDGRAVALLTVFRSQGVSSLDDAQSKLVRGANVSITTSVLDDGSTDVGYVWNRNGLTHVLHVNLVNGLSRGLADEVMASID